MHAVRFARLAVVVFLLIGIGMVIVTQRQSRVAPLVGQSIGSPCNTPGNPSLTLCSAYAGDGSACITNGNACGQTVLCCNDFNITDTVGTQCCSAAGLGCKSPSRTCGPLGGSSSAGGSSSSGGFCGNGIREGSEECDDGNQNDNDACLNSCMNAVCGDSILRFDTEQCDEGGANGTPESGCTLQCNFKVICGNGIKQGNEECDDGNSNDGDGCSSCKNDKKVPCCVNWQAQVQEDRCQERWNYECPGNQEYNTYANCYLGCKGESGGGSIAGGGGCWSVTCPAGMCFPVDGVGGECPGEGTYKDEGACVTASYQICDEGGFSTIGGSGNSGYNTFGGAGGAAGPGGSGNGSGNGGGSSGASSTGSKAPCQSNEQCIPNAQCSFSGGFCHAACGGGKTDCCCGAEPASSQASAGSSNSASSDASDASDASDSSGSSGASASDASNGSAGSAIGTSPQDLLARYTFDAVVGDVVPDDSGNGRDGTRVDALPKNKCMWFDGIDDRVVVPNFDRQIFTYSAWILREDPAKTTPVLFVSTNSLGWGVGQLSNAGVHPDNLNPTGPGHISFALTDGSQVNQQDFRISTAKIGINVFHHIAITYDGSRVRFYIDGQLDSDQPFIETFNSGGTYQMGWRRAPSTYEAAFKGFMDDVRIYGRALSDADILALASPVPDCSDPVMTSTSSRSISTSRSSVSSASLTSSSARSSSSPSSSSTSSSSSTPSSSPTSSTSSLAIPVTCGNGTVESGETCDDGNTMNTDGCTNACQIPVCGDGLISGNEKCDDGLYNASLPDACRPNCKLPVCGDGISDTGESCDDGNRISIDTCTNSCRRALKQPCMENDECSSELCINELCVKADVCGNGIREKGEWCDPGDRAFAKKNTAAVCTSSCQWELGQFCETDEACASGICRNGACVLEGVCGDGTVDDDEECDMGKANSNTIPNRCRLSCKKAYLGDGVIDFGEQCDDANTKGGDGCSPEGNIEQVAANPTIFELPQAMNGSPILAGILHQGAGSGLPAGQVRTLGKLDETGPAALAVMAAGAGAGFAWIRRRRR